MWARMGEGQIDEKYIMDRGRDLSHPCLFVPVHGSQIGGLARVVNAFTLTLKSSFHHPKKIQGSCQLWIQGNTFPCTTPLDPWLLWGSWPKKFPVQPKFTFVLLLHENIGFLDQTTSFLPRPPSPHPTHCCIVGGKLCHSLNHIGWGGLIIVSSFHFVTIHQASSLPFFAAHCSKAGFSIYSSSVGTRPHSLLYIVHNHHHQ